MTTSLNRHARSWRSRFSHISACELVCIALVPAAPLASAAEADSAVAVASHAASRDGAQSLERVSITASRPASLPVEIPTTLESITAAEIARSINAADSEDALKYFPSLNVRKRYIGDYDHAVLASRASGTGNSARSLVYADGILLSNLLGNGASYTPRWGLVTPEEIERVDVLYGPFSAAYSGNSAGAIVDFVTRSPKRFEAHAKLQGFTQQFRTYGTDDRFNGGTASVAVGSAHGPASWWLDLSRLDNTGQPIAFANKLVSAGVAGSAGTPVTGAVPGRNPSGKAWLILGDTNRIHTQQDHVKLKLAYDLSPVLRAAYTFGLWHNTAERSVSTYLRDAQGQPVYGSTDAPLVNIAGRDYSLAGSDFAPSRGTLEHRIHGLSLKSNTRGTFDGSFTASLYDYASDRVRAPLGNRYLPDSAQGGAGRITDLGGTGWNTLALKGIWRPDGEGGTHIVEAGWQRDAFKLRTLVSDTPDWLSAAPAARFSAFNGNTTLQSLWVQDAWRFDPRWKAVIGGRYERWHAFNGSIANASSTLPFGARSEAHISPKAALSFAAAEDWQLKASIGRAVRMPTVAELYQGAIAANTVVNNDPTLKPERSWTTEWTAERTLDQGMVRATLFHERTADALYSQTNVNVTPNVTNIQNVDAIRTTGMELAAQADNVGWRGLTVSSSVTFAASKIAQNDKFPASVGQWQPRVPQWRATLLATYAPSDTWAVTTGVRYSGRQYGTLDNSDSNGDAYTGVSNYLVADLRLRLRIDSHWKLALGIDNLGNTTYWAFHPYPQRSLFAELSVDL